MTHFRGKSAIEQSMVVGRVCEKRRGALSNPVAGFVIGLAAIGLSVQGARAADATWSGGVSGQWGDPLNWSGGVLPDGTATFSATGASTITLPPSPVVNSALVPTSVDAMVFDASAQAYTFKIGVTNVALLTFTGAGIVNNSSNQQTFINGLGLYFLNSSSAGTAFISNLSGLDFRDTSSAGNATIVNNPGVFLNFSSSSTAGNATITNHNWLGFYDTTTAGNASINNAADGTIYFVDSSNAGSATIVNDGTVTFSDPLQSFSSSNTSAGDATITNNNVLEFSRRSTAGNATIENNGSVTFFNFSTGGYAAITNGASAVIDFSASAGSNSDHILSIGSTAGSGNIYLGENQLAVGGNGLSTAFAGVISDCGSGAACLTPALGGSLAKVGAGTLTLSATNTYTGTTEVSDGVLLVDGSIATSSGVSVKSGGTLGGVGTLSSTSVESGGVLAAGNASLGTLSVAGNLAFQAGSTYAVDLTPSASDKTVVTGTAALAGTVQANFASGSYLRKSYVLLSASGGLGGTKFSALNVVDAPALKASLAYSATDVSIDLTAAIAETSGLNRNQRAVGTVIDNAFNSGGGIGPDFATLLGLPQEELANGLTQLSGETAADATQAPFNAMNTFLGLMLGNTGEQRGATAPLAFTQPDELPAIATAFAESGSTSSDHQFGQQKPNYAFWGSVYGGQADVDGDTAVGSNAVSDDVRGIAVGVDYTITPDTLAGFALSGGSTSWSLDNGLGGGDSNILQAGVYGKTRMGPAYLAGALAYAFHDSSTDRTVTIAGTDQLAADFDVDAVGARVEGGYRLDTPWLVLTPYAAVQAQAFHTPSYSEYAKSGSATFALDYAAETTSTMRTEIGTGLDRAFALADAGSLILQGRAAWVHDFNNDRRISAGFQTLPGASFTIDGAKRASDGALLSAGAEVKLTSGLSLGGRFDGEFSSSGSAYAETVNLRYEL
ncbi:MAG: autotransporter domain-containing protein [Parvibaculum sp.]|uniref:autotransporter outer membrane beta-barrel domain-containing protein n=1 Tax=Parvibaculum sp. TaxID=2024848 RepID=UPI003C7468E2